jgi:hypothetical protein
MSGNMSVVEMRKFSFHNLNRTMIIRCWTRFFILADILVQLSSLLSSGQLSSPQLPTFAYYGVLKNMS